MKLLSTAIQTGESRYQPEMNLSQSEAVDQERLARMVGYVAIGLPTATIFVGLFLSTCFYDSISHYYYSQFWGSVFIGSLIFIGTYLLVWQGQSPGERVVASIAAPFAWGIALFPTSGPGCTDGSWEARVFADMTYDADTKTISLVPADPATYFELLHWAETAHLVSAAIMFVVLAYLSLRVFTRIVPERDMDENGNLKPAKARRNKTYKTCGRIMILSIAALGGRAAYGAITGSDLAFWNPWNLTLIFEAIALYAFGYSWMVKGRFWGRYVDS